MPEAGAKLTPADYAETLRRLEATGKPLLLVSEGGYPMSGIVEAATAIFEPKS